MVSNKDNSFTYKSGLILLLFPFRFDVLLFEEANELHDDELNSGLL